jgi:kelch-like protein 24/35
MASNQKQSNSRSGLFGTIATLASVSAGVTVAVISEKNKLDQELKLKNAECDNCFVIAEKLIASKGDLIEIQRDIYAHWAVYVGDGEIIHLLDFPDGKAQVVCQKLKEIAEGCVCRVNNLVKAAQRRQLVPKSVNDILKSAYEKLNDVFDYHLINNNCEHFATHCRYGSRFSEQALAVENKPIIKNVGPLLARSSPVVAASVARLANNTTY